jgi:hypothetical protein
MPHPTSATKVSFRIAARCAIQAVGNGSVSGYRVNRESGYSTVVVYRLDGTRSTS